MPNTGMTMEGRNHVNDVALHGTSPVSPWYVGLIRDDSYVSLDAADTLASHVNWQEADEYTGTRKEYVEAASASGVTTNSASKASFAITGTQIMKGAFLASVTSGSAGTLLCHGLFSGGDQAVDNGDTLQITAQITTTDVV